MLFSCDRTGFPLVAVEEVAVHVQFLPVTKAQFEGLIAEPNPFGDSWYEEVLRLNPRVTYRRYRVDERPRLFLTGILPDEALHFARWMGEGFDLPTVEEWRAIYAALSAQSASWRHLSGVLAQFGAPPARLILDQLVAQLRPRSLLDLSLMTGGVVEWVRKGAGWVGLGAPQPELQPSLWNPLVDEVRPNRPGERLPYFGLRLVKRDG